MLFIAESKTSPKDMMATAWIAFHRANTHASSDAGLWVKLNVINA